MGHEYVEIKNTNAAIASYRRAVGKLYLTFLSPLLIPVCLSDLGVLRRCE